MNNQEIIDNAPDWADTHRKLLGYPDCTTYANNADDEQVLDRSLADIKRIAELEKAIRYSSDYLDDNKLNSIGSGSKAHVELREALKEQGDE